MATYIPSLLDLQTTKADDSTVVHNTGDETIAGTKTFSSTIVASITGNAATVTTNANLTGNVTSVGNVTTIANLAVTNAMIANSTISLTAKVTGILPEANGGTNQSTYTLGDLLYSSATNTLTKLAGNTTATKKFLRQTGTGSASAAPAWDTVTAGDITGAALTKTDDTNVTLTLGGSPATALLNATSITVGWTGTLAATRIAFNSTNLQNTAGALNTIQNIATTSSPTFAGVAASSTGIVTSSVTSTTTGSTNTANFVANRGDQANGTASTIYETAGIVGWETGMLPASTHYFIRDGVNNVRVIDITPGSGTTSKVTFAGNINIAGLSNVNILATDGANNVISGNLSGDVTSSGLTTTIATNAVTYAKFQQVAASSLVGNPTGSLANAQGITLGTSLTFSSSTINTIQGIRTADSPTFSGLTIGTAASSGTTAALNLSGALADGNYINVGGGGRNIGVFFNGPLFFTYNLDYNHTGTTYQYGTTAAAFAMELRSTGGFLKYAASGTAGTSVTPSTALSWNSTGVINIPGLTASSLIATDGSSNLTVSTTSLNPQFNTLGLGTGATAYALTLQPASTGLIQFLNSSAVSKWQLLMQGASNNNLGFTESGVASNRFVIAAGGNIGIGVAAPAYSLDSAVGDIAVTLAGKTFRIKQGSNACSGTGAVLVGGTVTVSTTAVATGDIILLNCTAAGGTQGIVRTSISNGVSFTITSSQSLDTSTYSWVILKAA